MSAESQHIWSFDIGTGSFGIAVRQGLQFKYVDSLLIPDGFASIDAARTRRRMWRTRAAHKAREQWLRDSFARAGLTNAILTGRRQEKQDGKWRTLSGDYRLEREFPPRLGSRTHDGAPSDAAGADTCYCGAVLRIRLLQGQKLQPWQIFKTLHSAIQKRGYDPDIPWKAQERGVAKEAEAEAKVTMTRANEAQAKLHALPEGCRFPCYLEAQLMGLWSADAPDKTSVRQTHEAATAKNLIFLRRSVEGELRALIGAAVKQLPALAPHADDLLYGPSQQPYASYNNRKAAAKFKERTGQNLVRGKATDWQGLLSQKIPTFDNRAIDSCALIPRFHAAKCEPRKLKDGSFDPDSLLPAEVTFLMKLKNFRFALGSGEVAGFTVEQMRTIFEDRHREVTAKGNPELYKFTEKQLEKIIARCDGVSLLPNQTNVEPPRVSGRSRFSKPALRLVKKLILSGKSPEALHADALAELNGNSDPLRGLVPGDLQWLLNVRSSGGAAATWANFYLPDESLSFVENAGQAADAKIRSLIGRQNNPVVRHRLETFWKLLREMREEHGEPQHVAIEFVREDFMGPKAKMELARFQKERRDARAEARKEAGPGRDGLRYQLMKDQGGCCIYCEATIGLKDLPNLHLDHIVPDQMGGPGAYWNFALCCTSCNSSKTKRTPWQWFHEDHRGGWDGYVERVRSRTFQLRAKKVRLLTQQDAPEQVQRYQTLAETAWIARLAQMLVCLFFGWPRNFAGGQRRVVVLPGGLTARVRRKYGLNSLLGQDIAALEAKLKDDGDAKVESEIDKKCRADKRHHALDAMVLSFLPQWTSNPTKQVSVKLPDKVNRETIGAELDKVVPANLCFEKPALEESLYGQRRTPEFKKPVATKRFALKDLGYTGINSVFQAKTLVKDVAKILDPGIRAAIQQFIRETEPDADAWQHFCKGFRQPGTGGNGPLVRNVRLVVAEELTEFADLSKGDARPALRRGDRHRGYYLYADTAGKVRVRPVYVFQSPGQVRKELLAKQGREVAEIIGFFQSGCAVVLDGAVDHPKTPLKAGTYKLNTIRADGFVKVTSATGVVSEPISAQKLLAAGFAREKK
jgi:CRISPR-associated endonuclease Csn1